MYMDEAVAQQAVELTGFGRFNVKLTICCALVFLNCACCITSVGFVVPTAACDFQMTTIDKGRINAAPMLGMVIGSFVWGYFADLKGRRSALLMALFCQFTVDVISSVVPNYWVFVFLKFASGVSFTGQLSIVFTYLGEFQPIKYRNTTLSFMELSWAVGVIFESLFAWAVIPNFPYAYKTESFFFSSWNLFVLTSALPALLAGIWLLTLPETPKFLAENGKRDELLRVLTRMSAENTGSTAEQFKEKLASSALPSIKALAGQSGVAGAEEAAAAEKKLSSSKRAAKLKDMLASSKEQLKTLLRKPYLKRMSVCSSIMFCMTSTYYSLMTWFPELFQRFADFEAAHPGEFASVCTVSRRFANQSDQAFEDANLDLYGCNTPIDTSVYVHSAILGVACLPCAILLPLTVDYIGYRIYLLFTATIACAVTIAFFFVRTSTQNLVLSCIFEAFTSLNISVVLCLLVELFPTNLRIMATGITLVIGRTGSLFGNTLFGYLIDDYCSILIIVMAAQLFFAASMSWSAPSRDKMREIQGYPGAAVQEVQNKAYSPAA